ncbi:MAG: ribonuclease HII [Flavobacteriales bacterium]
MGLIINYSNLLEAGVDEAGRGCLAGPVVAAAVVLPPDFVHEDLNDSKQLNARTREKLRVEIELNALAWSVQMVHANEIDQINILRATFKAMNMAILSLQVRPEFLIIDGNRFRTELNIPYQCIVGGDAKYQSIAAASILAKTYRDDYMVKMHQNHPQYGWDKNKGYGTIFHRRAITEIGLCAEHRHTFRLKENQLSLFQNPI